MSIPRDPSKDTTSTNAPAAPDPAGDLLRAQLDRADTLRHDATPHVRAERRSTVEALYDGFGAHDMPQAMLAMQSVVMSNVGVECFHRAHGPGTPPANRLAEIGAGSRLFGQSGLHSERIARRQGARRPAPARPKPKGPDPEWVEPIILPWAKDIVPFRSWDMPKPAPGTDPGPDPAPGVAPRGGDPEPDPA